MKNETRTVQPVTPTSAGAMRGKRRDGASVVACAVFAMFSAGCLDLDQAPSPTMTEDGTADVGTDTHEIVMGANTVTDSDVNPRWPQVVDVCTPGGCCSGTVVSPVHVLTAGHCRIAVGDEVDLAAQRGTGSGPGRHIYNVIETNILSTHGNIARDLELVLLDHAIPSFGDSGSPEYSVKPAFAFAALSNTLPVWTVGYGNSNDCNQTGFGTRRGLSYLGGFHQYPGMPGVITRPNLPCDDANKGPSPGDSGGPLLDIFGRVVGVFSGWGCRDAAGNVGVPGCTGTVEWSGVSDANATWLSSALAGDFDRDGVADVDDPRPGLDCTEATPPADCADVLPDFEVINIAAGGCTGPDGYQRVAVTVRNNGPVARSAWVDVFKGRTSVPRVGSFSNTYRRSNTLAMRETQTLWFAVSPTIPNTWVRADVVLDTTSEWTELDERNNVRLQYVKLADCSFN